MPPPTFLKEPVKVTFNIEREQHKVAVAKANGQQMSFSEYLCRLINLDLRRKRSMAGVAPRTFRGGKT